MNHRLLLVAFSIALLSGCTVEEGILLQEIRTIPFEGNESSGVTYSPTSDTFFVVSDQGYISEVTQEGEVVRRANMDNANLEGITRDVNSGMLYVVIEGKDRIVEIDPLTLDPGREFTVERKLEGERVTSGGKQGFEGITFVPNPEHPEGGTFFVVNQVTPDQKKPEPSAILEIELPLRTASVDEEEKKALKGKILQVIPMKIFDLSGVDYYETTNQFYLLSDTLQQIFVLDRAGNILEHLSAPRPNQEGLTHDGDGNIAIVQDEQGSGSVVIFSAARLSVP